MYHTIKEKHLTSTTMTAQFAIEVAKRVKEICPASNAYEEGGCVLGSYRGKSSEKFSYLITAKAFQYNNAGYIIREAIEQAIAELSQPVVLSKSDRMKQAHAKARDTKHLFSSYREALANAMKK